MIESEKEHAAPLQPRYMPSPVPLVWWISEVRIVT